MVDEEASGIELRFCIVSCGYTIASQQCHTSLCDIVEYLTCIFYYF